MRSIWLASVFAVAFVGAAQAQVSVLVPPVVAAAGLRDIATAYTKQAGQDLKVNMSAMTGIVRQAETASPASDLVALPSDLMDQLEHDHGIVPGSRKHLGRMEIDLVVPVGAPHPDVSTPEKLVDVLKGAKGVAFDDPAGGTMMAWLNQSLLAHNEFKGVHAMPSRDPLAAVANGEADFALKLADEIDRNPKVTDAGPLPPYYGVHIDLEIAISSRAADPKAAQKAIDYLLSPAADTIWASKHLARR